MDLESLRNGVLATTLPLDQRISFVDPRDVGDVAVARLLSVDWAGRHTQGVLGPADLSFSEVADLLSTASGREIVAQQVSDNVVAQQLAGFGMTAAQVDGVVGMLRGFAATSCPRTLATSSAPPRPRWSRGHIQYSGRRCARWTVDGSVRVCRGGLVREIIGGRNGGDDIDQYAVRPVENEEVIRMPDELRSRPTSAPIPSRP